MSRFVEVPTDRLVSELESIGGAIEERGGHCRWGQKGRERVYVIALPRGPGEILVYTSCAVGSATARECGRDAIRVVVGARHPQTGVFYPSVKAVKILRTAPAKSEDRAGAVLGRLRTALRAAYVQARSVAPCPDCGAPMTPRSGRNGGFLGCADYPRCMHTEPLRNHSTGARG